MTPAIGAPAHSPLLGMPQKAARLHRFRRVHCVLAQLDTLNDALFVDDERRALRQLVTRAPHLLLANRHSVLPEHFEVRVAQQGEMNVDLARKCRVRCRAVTTNSKNNRVTRFQLWPISLIGFQFAASSLGEGEHVEDEDDVLFPSKLAELDLLPIIAEQREVRGLVSGAQQVCSGALGVSRSSKGQGGHCAEKVKTSHG